MAQINLFKIDHGKRIEFFEELESNYNPVGEPQNLEKTFNNRLYQYEFALFLDDKDTIKEVEWKWLTQCFSSDRVTSRSNPKGILTIETSGEVYACTFGYSHYLVNKYCDSDFAFAFARRLKFKEVKRTALLSPSSKRNKAVNTYIDYTELEFDSGESFAKLKVKANLPDDFKLFKETVEVGRSIKIIILENTLEAVIDALYYVQHLIVHGKENYKIPLFYRISDKGLIEELESNMAENIEKNGAKIYLSELDIVGVQEVFYDHNSSFELRFNRKTTQITDVDQDEVESFIRECGLSAFEGLKKVRLVSYTNGDITKQNTLYELIDSIDDENRCLLTQGKWYQFNDDYLAYLEDSLAEIEVVHEPKYNYSAVKYKQFISERKETGQKIGLELAFNLELAEKHGFECHDRELIYFNGNKIELMDLFKDETLISVKFGNAASKLSYVVDQSLSALKFYKHRFKKDLPDIKRVALWIVLERKTELELKNGTPDLSKLGMFTFKNRIDGWKKEVRLLGYTPIIYLNYYKN